jgi:lysophospholipase L1-like esterase
MIMSLRNYKILMMTCLVFISLSSFSQTIRIDEAEATKKFPYVSLVFNRIFNNSGLDSFYRKLSLLKKSKKGQSTIVHIGDSHVESGFYPGAVKKGLQDFFGDSVAYHSFGINGARYETFNSSANFWEQISGLHADLYIVSLGTNEAQGNGTKEADFLQQVNSLIERLKKTSPHAAILITTCADSFKSVHPIRDLWDLNISLFTWCSSNNIPVWDLYRTTNGFGSAYNWIKSGMMDKDGVHYTAKAYEIQGRLLFNALAKGYNSFVSSY